MIINTSNIVIPTKVGIQFMLAGYGSPPEFTPRKRSGDDTSLDFTHTLELWEREDYLQNVYTQNYLILSILAAQPPPGASWIVNLSLDEIVLTSLL